MRYKFAVVAFSAALLVGGAGVAVAATHAQAPADSTPSASSLQGTSGMGNMTHGTGSGSSMTSMMSSETVGWGVAATGVPMMRQYPDMAKVHEQMMRQYPDMAKVHEQMMRGSSTKPTPSTGG
jgi:hypothetical protein